ncbi:MAG: hypothetical protein ONB05_08435, partial [candidate division KSB1 bacterium]|nr:hypothetical protein [candidate division KSB1 bacterium]
MRSSSMGMGSLLLMILLGISPVQGANPKVVSAAYIDSTNVLQIVFDQPVFTDSTRVIRTGITLDGDNGGGYPNVTLTGGFLSGKPELSETVNLFVNFADQMRIESMKDRETLELVLASNSFINASYEGNPPLTVADNVTVPFIEDPHPPVPSQVIYDANINRIKIVFDQVVDVKNISLSGISLDDDFAGPKRDVIFSSDNEKVVTKVNSETIEIDVDPVHQQLIESFNVNAITLTLKRYTFLDLNRNSNKLITATDSVRVTFIPDSKPTVVYNGHYDAGENKLRLFFNEKVVTTYWGKEAVRYKGITIQEATEQVTLSGGKSVAVFADTTLVIEVLPADQRLIEGLAHKEALKLTLQAYSVLDANGNGIRDFTLEDNIPVSYKEEDPKDTPIVTEARYHATKNELELTFGNITGTTRGIDTTSVELTGITLDDDPGGPNPDVTLTGGKVQGIKAGVPAFIRKIIITVTPEDEAKIERMANKNSLYLVLEPLTFFFESYTKTRNGNHALATGIMPVQYLPDTVAAEIKSVKYDYLEDRLYLTFNKLIQYDKFQPTGIEISGVRLTGGALRDSAHTSVITLDVNATDQAHIEGLPESDKTNLKIKINSGTVLNLDDVPNATLSLQDGALTTAGDTVLVGYGRKFWEKSFEAFPTADRLIPASLRAVGEHSYFYVADDQWTRWREAKTNVWVKLITQAQVDSLRDAFELRTPAEPSKGIYQICREVFGQEKDTDGDSRIYVLLLDVRDEYGQGRNARLNNLAKAGYFEPRNEQPDSVYAHSNEADMIYIDIDPVLQYGKVYHAMADMFQRMISHHVDPDEEQWLVEGMSAIAQKICGYEFTTYQFPVKKLVPSSQDGLTSWVAWSGGLTIDITNVLNSFLFTLYLYEQYGGQDLLKTIAADTTNGLTSIDNALSSRGETKRVFDIFDDYAMACYLNIVGHPVYGNRYGFQAYKRTGSILDPLSNPFGPPGQVLLDWAKDTYWNTGAPWSMNYFKIKQKDIPNFVVFNG